VTTAAPTPPSPRPPHLLQVSSNYIDARLPTVITAAIARELAGFILGD